MRHIFIKFYLVLTVFFSHQVGAQIIGNSLAPLIEEVSPAVVSIAVTGTVNVQNPLSNDPFFRRFMPPNQEREFESAGSGVIVDAELGHIITNHHVIDNADEITITLIDNRTLSATVIGSDPGTDIAVLQVDPDNLTDLNLGDSSNVRVGDFVVAIGNPFGLQHTVTSGIVSALGRVGINPDGYEDFIQTDASINPGNSGGALIDLNGNLIGINSAILSQSGGNIGIGFAIPINLAKNIMDQIIESGSVRRGLLGVNIAEITEEIAESLSFESSEGALITAISPGSAAELAGLQIGDVVVEVNGEPISGPSELRNYIGMRRPDEMIEINVLRDGELLTFEATLGEMSANAQTLPTETIDEIEPAFAGVELSVESISGQTNQYAIAIQAIDNDSFAFQRGLRQGDLITHVNRVRVQSFADLERILNNKPGSLVLQVLRDDRGLLLVLK
jgi:serine protease DegQ